MLVRRAQRLLASATIAMQAFFALVPGRALADRDLARARVLDQQGVRAYREERYNDAIRFFEEARKLGGPPSEIWNIAKCHVRMDEPEEATQSIEEYLEQKGLTSADRAEAEQQLHEIQHRHSALTVASAPSGAAVYLEGHRWAGVTPATIDLPPGDHKVTIELAGYDPVERSVTAKYGRAVIVDAKLSKNDSAPTAAAGSSHSSTTATAPEPSETAPRSNGRPHRIVLAGEIGITVPRFGSLGGTVAPVGYLRAAYVAIDRPRAVVTLGLAAMMTGDSWSDQSGLPNTNPNCGATIPNGDSATAFSAFLEGGAAWRPASRWRIGGDLGLGIATYSVAEAGRDVFVPNCHPSTGVKPVVHLDVIASYAFTREIRLLLSPIILELQPAFDGASNAPSDATGVWLRFGAAAGIAFDVF
jgi:hypothetical protein